MNIEHGELKIDGNISNNIMKDQTEFIVTVLLILITAVIYFINFVQMIIALSNEQWNLAIIKAIGVFTALGSYITVWF